MLFGGKNEAGALQAPKKRPALLGGRSDLVSDFTGENQLKALASPNSENRKSKIENLLAGVAHARCAVAGAPLLCF
ncbi:hypothetical protein J3B00_003213 [Pseudomonas sp. BP8]|nr:hypothetical protein [Pseudomonas sp. BP8]